MKKTVFISYHFKDKTYKGEIVKWLEETGAKVISTDENDLRPNGDKLIEKKIKEQIHSSNIVLILVGNDTHNRPWVDYEVAVARSLKISTYCIQLAGRNGAAPKEVRSLTCIDYNKKAIQNLLKN